MKSVITALVFLAVNASAHAGTIHWGFVSTSQQSGSYSITGASGSFTTESGQTQLIDVMSGFTSPALVSPIPVEGPTLTTDVTITDTASGTPGTLVLPIRFYDNETAPDGEIDQHIAGYGSFDPQVLKLGVNRYTITGDGAAIYVSVASAAETPEPSTLALSAIGIAWLGVRRGRKKRV